MGQSAWGMGCLVRLFMSLGGDPEQGGHPPAKRVPGPPLQGPLPLVVSRQVVATAPPRHPPRRQPLSR